MKIWKLRSEMVSEGGISAPAGCLFSGLPFAVQRFLRSRKIDSDEALNELLNPRLAKLKDPFLIKGMKEGADRLLLAYKNNETVCVYGDFDLDGTSGLALLTEALTAFGFQNVIGYQPLRLAEGYGLHISAIEDLVSRGVKLLVTVDVGITATMAVARAKELGLDVIITDHHLPAEILPPAHTIINPNQPGCESGLKYLCGAGVAFYLVRALKRVMLDAGIAQVQDFDLRKSLDLLCVATLTDMVPLQGDNRALVKAGLEEMSKTPRKGIRALMQKLSLYGKVLTSGDVAIKFAPKLNALSRMEMGLRPIDIFQNQDESLVEQMVESILSNNTTRAELQSQGELLALKTLEGIQKPAFVFLVSPEFHRGVVGLIATKVAQNMNCPAFIGSLSVEGEVVGSARAPAGYATSLVEALASVSSWMNRFGGHFGAAGFEFHSKHESKIREGFELFFSEQSLTEREVVVEYDLDLKPHEVSEELMESLDRLGPYGQGFSAPLVRLDSVEIVDTRVLKGGHLKLWLGGVGKKGRLEALYFSPPPGGTEGLVPGSSVNLLGELQWNDFAGQRNLQILIREIRVNSSLDTEVVSEVC